MRTKGCCWNLNRMNDFFKSAAGPSVFLLIFFLLLLISPANSGAAAGDWPTKPISLIAPWSAGGSTDLAARALAPSLSKILGVPVSVINKPGGSGIIGTLETVKSAPDGYTLLMDCNGTSSIQFAWSEKLPYKPEERTYIARAVYTNYGIAVPASSPWKKMDDVVNFIRTNPAAFRWSLIGGTGVPDVCTVQLRADIANKGVDVSKTRMVTFKGSGEVVVAIAGGHVDIGYCSPSVAGALLSAGKIRILAVNGDKRYKGWPNVPTLAEAGFPSVDQVWWAGLSGPPGMPEPVVKKISDAVREAIRDPEVLTKLDNLGFVPIYQPSEEFKKFVLNDAKAVKALKLK